MQIIVLGMHRSGTSLITRLINMMGAYFGPEGSALGFGQDNPKGFWERKDVIHINDTLLKSQACEWDRVENWNAPSEPPQVTVQLQKTIKTLVMGMDAFRPWVMKDPRLCLTLPYWKPVLEVPVAVIVYRDPREVAQSLLKRNGLPLAFGLALWEAYVVSLLNASLDMPRVFVPHRDFIENPVRATARLHAELIRCGVQGLRLPSAREITAFADPALYRAKADASLMLSEAQTTLTHMLQGAAPQPGPLTLPVHVQETLRTFTQTHSAARSAPGQPRRDTK